MHFGPRNPVFLRACCALLVAVAVVPEVRCCCNLSWGPAGLGHPQCPMEAAAKPKCTCCCRKSESTSLPAHGVAAVPADSCECQFHVVASAPQSLTSIDLGQVLAADFVDHFESWCLIFTSHDCCPEYSPTAITTQTDTALEMRAVLSSWQISPLNFAGLCL